MLLGKIKFLLLICVVILEVAALKPSLAANCEPYKPKTPETSTVTLAGNFYAGNDMPVGSVIFNTIANTESSSIGVLCLGGPFELTMYQSPETEPMGPPTLISGTPFTGNRVYPTNVQGVGLVLWNTNVSYSKSEPFEYTVHLRNDSNGGGSSIWRWAVGIALVKTGPIASGTSVSASSIPQIITYIPPQGGHTGLPITLWTVSFTGSINFITQTCSTSDYQVQMGRYDAKASFRGEGTFTEWKDASILLQNCPTFTGYHDAGTPQEASGSEQSSGTNKTANMLKVSLQPLSDVIDSEKGLIKVTALNGSYPATGVSLQLGYSESVNATPTIPAMIWKNGVSWRVSAPDDGSSTIKIPLAARYYQTGKNVTPGRADGKVMFTISYE